MDFFHVIGDYLADSWNMMVGRSGGPFHLRLILQPTVALILGIRAGLKDARAGHSPYFWSIFKSDAYDRRALLRHGWGDVKKVFIIALVLDLVYEIVVFRWVYPVQALLMAIVLALVPYLIFRGLVNRMTRKKRPS
jgi:hypothetical protein